MANPIASTLNKAIVFNRAGHFMLQKYCADGTLDPDGIYCSTHGIVKNIQRASTPATADLEDGNSDYPAHTYVTGNETTLTAGLSTHDPILEAFVTDSEITESGATEQEFRTAQTVSVGTVPVALVEKVKDETCFLYIKDKFGNVYKPAAADPTAAGEYKLTVTDGTATLAFAAAEAGKELFVVYDAYVPGVTAVSYREKTRLAAFRVTVFADCMAYDETQEICCEIVIDKANLSGGLTSPNQSKDPTGGCELVFKTSAPRPGYSPVQLKYRPKTTI